MKLFRFKDKADSDIKRHFENTHHMYFFCWRATGDVNVDIKYGIYDAIKEVL